MLDARAGRVLVAMVRDELRARWSGGVVSWAWLVLQPLAQIVIFAVVFGYVMTTRSARFPDHRTYIVYLCLGFFPWLAFSDGLARGATSLIEGRTLMRCSPLPLILFPLRAVLAAWPAALVALAMVAVASPLFGLHVHSSWFLLPLPVLSLIGLGAGIACGLAPATVLFRDTAQLVHLVLPLLMWTAPIVYIPDILPNWAQGMQRFHPLAPALDAMHAILLDGAVPGMQQAVLLVAYPGLALVFGWILIRILDSEVRDAL